MYVRCCFLVFNRLSLSLSLSLRHSSGEGLLPLGLKWMPDNAFVIAAVTMDDPHATRRNVSHFCIAGIFTGALSRALTVIFALVGAFTGAITGALAGRASESGLLRGAGLGAVAGAVLSIEVLEASRAYWYSERSGSRHSSSMADFIEELLNGRLAQEQVDISDISYEELFGVLDDVDTRGLSGASLENLPSYRITDEKIKDGFGDEICCAICLQDLEQGETARSLPHCQHTFHMSCVDKWLIRHGSCPVCRQLI